jgi:glycosyltransferase 2 family protein
MPDDRSPDLSSPTASASRAAGAGSSHSWLGWGLALAAIAGCLLFIDIDDILARMRRMEAREIALVLALMTCDRVLMALKWRLLLGLGGAHLSPLTVIRFYYQGCLVGALLPSIGGDLLRAHLVAQRTGVVHPVFASLLMEKMIGFASTVNWGILGGVTFISHFQPGYWPIWIFLGLLAAIVANGVFLLSLHKTMHDFALGLLARYQQARLMSILHKLYAAYAGFSNHPGVLLGNLALALLEQALQMLILFTIATSLGIALQPFIFAAAAALRLLIIRIPITPDGWGTGELVAIAVFGLVGVSAASAFSMSVIYRFLGMAAVLLGFVLMALCSWRCVRPTA